MEIPVFQFVLFLVFSLGDTAKSLAPPSLFALSCIYTHWSVSLEPSFPWGKWSQMSILVCHMFQSCNHLHVPSLDLLQYVCVSSTGELRTWISILHECWQDWEEGKDRLPCPAESAVCLMSPRCYCPSWAAEAQHWLIFSLLFTGFLRPFSETLLWCFCWLSPSMYWSREFFLPRCRTWHLPLLDYIKFLFSHCTSLLRSLWAAAQSFGLPDPLPNFVQEQIDCTDLSLKNSR